MLFVIDEILFKNNNMKVLQFTPFFPPHKGWLEIVAENISKYLVKGKYSEVINITSSIGQESNIQKLPKIIFKKETIGYHINDYQVITIPSIEIVHNFPCPKFRKKQFRTTMRYIKIQKPDIIQTHTRFFLQTFLGWIIAKRLKKPRVHVEHGSWFVTGIIRWKKLAARLYDQTLWRLAFTLSNKIISINKTNLKFIQRFVSPNKCEVIYNGIELPQVPSTKKIKTNNIKIIFIGRLIWLKGVSVLINSCKELIDNWTKNFSLDIIWDWEEKNNLENQTKKLWISKYINFLWPKDHNEITTTIIPQTDILVNPSYQEWLPTTVLEWLLGGCVVVATDVGWTSEISPHPDLILVKSWNIFDLQKWLKYAIQDHKKLQWLSITHIKETFNRERSIKKYFESYKKVI